MEELLFLAHRIPYPPNKGDKIRSWNSLKYLSERYRVRLGCLIDDPHDRQYIPELERHCAEVVAVPISPRAQRLRSIFGLRPGMPLSAAYFRTRELSNWVASAIEANRIGRAFVFSTPMMGSLPQRHGMRVVLDMVDVDSEKWRVMAHKAPFPQRLIYAREGRTLLAYERTAAAAAAKVLLCTKEELALFLTRAPEATGKAGWMANGVDTAYFSPDHAFANPLPGDRPLIVFTGDMSYWPNVDAVAWFARLVLPSLLARWPRPLFLIVGARPTLCRERGGGGCAAAFGARGSKQGSRRSRDGQSRCRHLGGGGGDRRPPGWRAADRRRTKRNGAACRRDLGRGAW